MTPEIKRLRAETDAAMPDAFSRYRALAAERAAWEARVKELEAELARRPLCGCDACLLDLKETP